MPDIEELAFEEHLGLLIDREGYGTGKPAPEQLSAPDTGICVMFFHDGKIC